jgi:L-malate glycosyltransferase
VIVNRPPFKVAFISHSCVESSSRKKLAYLVLHTDLRLITPSWYPMPFGRYDVDFEFNSEVFVQSYPISFFNVKRTSTRWFLRSRDLGLSQFQPDIIHVENEYHSWIVCQALLYRRLFVPRAKVIVFSWDNLLPEELNIKDQALEHLARFNRRFVNFSIAGNKAAKEILLAKGVPADKVEVIPQFGIDPEMFYPFTSERRQGVRQSLGISPDELVIGYVGRLMKEKGLFDLIEAVNKLRTTEQRKIVLVLMGKGVLEQAMRSMCGELGLRHVFLPARKNDQVAEVMNVMDVLVLPTHTQPPCKEQFGRVLIEAMACGVPVIGSSSGEIPNVIGDAGLVFRERDCEKLAECLRSCRNNEGLRLELRERGLDRVLKNYTNEKIAQQTLEIYERVIQAALPANRSTSEQFAPSGTLNV